MTSSTEATLSGSFSGASSVPSEVGFYWGTSSNSLTNKVVADAASSTSGTFTAKLTGLTEGETYVYQAYAIVSGTGSHSSETQTFYASGTKYFKAGEASSSSSAFCGWLELPGGEVVTRQSASEGFKYISEDSRYITDVLMASGKRNYTHYYDTKMYTSMWTAYPLYSAAIGSGRTDDWSYNPNIDTKYQVNLCNHSYAGSYSKGHLIPNGARNGNNTMQKQTFYVTNSVPQVQNGFNGGIWNDLEKALRSIAQNADTVYVVTGVAFNKLGESKTINTVKAKDDTKDCPIPNYFYKVALKVKRSGSSITAASAVGVWMENRVYDDKNYANCAVSVDQIEEWTGLDFFVNLPKALQTEAEKNSSWTTFKNFK